MVKASFETRAGAISGGKQLRSIRRAKRKSFNKQIRVAEAYCDMQLQIAILNARGSLGTATFFDLTSFQFLTTELGTMATGFSCGG